MEKRDSQPNKNIKQLYLISSECLVLYVPLALPTVYTKHRVEEIKISPMFIMRNSKMFFLLLVYV